VRHHPASLAMEPRETGFSYIRFHVDNLKTPGRSFGRFVNANASGRQNPNSVACARVFLKANLYAEDTTGTLFRCDRAQRALACADMRCFRTDMIHRGQPRSMASAEFLEELRPA
jgi:hypothetical protein